jgi:hypothetical protein
MPIDFLTVTERERLNRFPNLIPDEDLRVFLVLSQIFICGDLQYALPL